MGINVTIKRKFKINGKEYNSIEEVPPDIRNTFKKAMASQAGTGNLINLVATRTKIIFNGREYNGIDAMPQDVRQLYEKVLKAAETGAVPADIITASNVKIIPTIAETSRTASVGIKGTPTKFEHAFSARKLIVVLMLIALIILFYFVF